MRAVTLFDSGIGDVRLDAALAELGAGVGTGTVENLAVSMVAGQDLGGHRLVKAGPDGRVVYADKDQGPEMVGLTLGAASAGAAVRIAVSGMVRETSWAWDISRPLYLGSNGTMVQNAPTSGVSREVGKPILPDYVLIAPQSSVRLA